MPANDSRQREALLALVKPRFSAGERVVAMLPFANTPKRPKGPTGKVRDGIWQAARRYRPMVLTDRRLFVFDTKRTPHPQLVLADFPAGGVSVVRVVPGTLGRQTLVLDLPGNGEIPFELGRLDAEDLGAFTAALGWNVAPS